MPYNSIFTGQQVDELLQRTFNAGQNSYYMIDALKDGNVIRKRKYRKNVVGSVEKWYDYNGDEIQDSTELERVKGLATTHAQVDSSYDEHAVFMAGKNEVASLQSLPMDQHNIVVSWTPSAPSEQISMQYPDGFEGDEYAIYVLNAGGSAASVVLPGMDESTGGYVDGDTMTGSSFVDVRPGQTVFISAKYNGSEWVFGIVRKDSFTKQAGFDLGEADHVIFKFFWDQDSGSGMDGALRLSGTGVQGVDGTAVGYGMSGNGNETVENYIEWGGENTGSGNECFYINVGTIKQLNEALSIYGEMFASWYSAVGTGHVVMIVESYSGGTAQKTGSVFTVSGGTLLSHSEFDLSVMKKGTAGQYESTYDKVVYYEFDKQSGKSYLNVGDMVGVYEKIKLIETQVSSINTQIQSINNQIQKFGSKTDIQQALFIPIDHKPTSSDLSYMDGEESVDFVQGAFVRVADGSSYEFWKLASISGEADSRQAHWVKMYDTKFGDVALEQVYTGDYEIINVISGTQINGIKSEADEVKIVNGSDSNILISLNASVDEGVYALTSTLSATSLQLSKGASATFTKSGTKYTLSCLYGVTKFPDLQDSEREGTFAMTVSPSGDPILMEVIEARQWDESITDEQTNTTLNEKYPDVPIGFCVVCKTINKAYEKVNSYNMWVSFDITSLS